MENQFIIALSLVIAYLIGSIATAVWYGRWTRGIDIRDFGSGNAGATNTFRVLGRKAGFIVMFIDILKGCLATSISYFLLDYHIISQPIGLMQIALGVVATVGHIFPLYEKFKGGKGIATLLGMLFGIQWQAALVCLGIFLIILIVTKYVSLGSMLAALSYPLLMIYVTPFKENDQIIIGLGFMIFLMVVITHKKNVRRLLKGEENKTYLFPKKNS